MLSSASYCYSLLLLLKICCLQCCIRYIIFFKGAIRDFRHREKQTLPCAKPVCVVLLPSLLAGPHVHVNAGESLLHPRLLSCWPPPNKQQNGSLAHPGSQFVLVYVQR